MTYQTQPRLEIDLGNTPPIVGPGRYYLTSSDAARKQDYAPFGCL